MAIIAIVDYLMGEAAQTLNGYQILRRTFSEPSVARKLVFGKDVR